MSNSEEKLVQWLFDTKALRVCPQDKPFWYTSGTIGPYYVNTHFLYGSEDKANELLKIIDNVKEEKKDCPFKLLLVTEDNYNSDSIYKGLIDEMCNFISKNIGVKNIDYISGGERRDWFFSLIIAKILDKPHITIYKDLSTVITCEDKILEVENLSGKNVLHIADLITEASSYERAWIPAIKALNANLKWSLVVVDRKQGGEELLTRYDVKSYSMVNIDKQLFDRALSLELINHSQYEMIMGYIENPKDAMSKFLAQHPEFMENALKADEKTRERAKLCLEKGIYKESGTHLSE